VRSAARRIDEVKALPVAKNSRLRIFRYAALVVLLGFFLASAFAQQNDKKSFTFRGKVEQVNGTTKRLTVHSEPVEGWMRAMTMGFAVANDAVFNRVKAGDQITANVYEGEFTLHDVQLVPPGNASAAPGAATQGGRRLEDLEQMALASNPTVAQVQANMRVATGLARQAGFYPNPHSATTEMRFEAASRAAVNKADSSVRPSSPEASFAPPAAWRSYKQTRSRQAARFSGSAF
jgi:Cu/Ag efflux protein CusF